MSRKRKLVFLMGFKNVGKDTVAKKINEISGGTYHIVALADQLKKEFYPTIGIKYDKNNEDRAIKEKYRQSIISYGEAMKQKHGADYWVRVALDDLLFSDDNKNIIISDCRRAEEVYWYIDFSKGLLPDYKGIVDNFDTVFIAVHREGAEREDTDYLTHNGVRAATDNFILDGVIKNDKSLKDLKIQIENLYARKLK